MLPTKRLSTNWISTQFGSNKMGLHPISLLRTSMYVAKQNVSQPMDGRTSAVERPANSPDLEQIDFWCFLNKIV